MCGSSACTRKRRQLELNTRMAVLSFASLAGAALLGVALIVFGANFLSMIGLVNSGALV